ncbi:MAG: HYR domain-containing protein [Deltaproteobacteria bacterium]|nr:HYR domain-containing protein [Deltaproteobacteria bacterium]
MNGSAVDSCQAGAPGALELCNGIDDDCDGKTDLADPDIVRENCANQAGVCAGSKKTVCNGASGWQQCSDADYAASAAPYYAADDTSCDGRDNDCSGQADEGFVGTPVSCGNGVCAVTGNQVCVAGAIKVRIGQAVLDQCAPNAGAATNEVCDGLDNDCDGFVDAADPSLVKVNCEQQGGVCAGAQKAATLCVNGAWQACNSTTYSAHSQLYSSVDTTCNGVDNDCTGGTDDDYVAPLTACGVGRCAGTTGRMQCTNGQVADTCNPTANAVAELCNGQDDDCDGSTDETFQVGAACSVGQFACTSQGHFVCSGNGQGVVCDAQVINGTTESCDARDNDCDGATDEDFDLGASCTVGVGACARTGVRVCIINGAAGCSVTAGVGSVEICDGVDNDCNGRTDDGVCRLDTVISSGPDEVVSVSTAAFTFVDSVNPTNTHFECQFDGGAWFTCDGGVLVLNEVGDGAHTVLVRAVGPTGVVDDTPAYWSWEVDTTVPDTFVLAGPQNPSQSPEAAFVFGTNVANPSAWYCAVDPVGGAPSESEWSPCAATWTWASLTEGEHTVWVYVVNDLGIADTTPASYTWLIDTTAPGTSIISGPSAVSCEVGATFTFESPDDGEVASFRCRLDAAEWVPCGLGTITFAGLSDGRHLFSVAAVDANGNVDPTPAQFSWRVDTIAPNTSIDLKPQDPAQNSVATFAFSADEAGATFTCRLDAGPAGPCQSPVSFNGLADGSHTFSVYASDLGCKSDESPATYTWLVDTRFPDTAYLTTPPVLNGFDDPNSFTYEDPTAPANTTFECSLDGAAWTPCNGGSLQAGVLAIGQHTLSVKTCERLSDAVVQCDPTPAVYGWQVTASPCPLDREAPILGCIEGPVLECVAGGATFEVGALSPAASDDCAPLAVTTSHEGTAPLGVSPVVFSAVDGNGNASSCVTLVSVVDTQPPQITCPAAVELTAPADACGAVYDLGAAVAVDACFGTNVSSYSNAPAVFGVGETTVTYTALDASGNASTCTTKVVVLDKTPVALTCDSEVTRVAPASACAWTGTLTATATDNCAVDVTVVERSNTYNVGVQAVEFTARDDSGNTAACETTLTVVDETAPVVDCGTLTGPVPATVTVTATDACTAIAAVTGFTCTRIAADGVRTELADEDCAVSFEGAVLSIDARLESGELEVGYGVEASDPAGNRTTRECVVSLVADLDRDGLIDELDNCPSTANTDQADTDDDGLGDVCDVCPTVSDADQVDSDANGIGDACQDTDEDTILDLVDNCPVDANTAQLDFDHDGLGNECDPVDDEIVAGGSGSLGCAGVAGGGLGAMFGVVVLLAWRMRRARAARRSGLA